VTNAFSKKFENHMHMVALYTVWYNYVKQHKSLKGLSPAIAAGLSDTLWSMADVAEMVDTSLPKPGMRGHIKRWPKKIQTETLPDLAQGCELAGTLLDWLTAKLVKGAR
jgi:hypothetical protein